MKLKLFIFNILLSLLLFTSNGFAKNIPPGSGIGDVPANVLILLDKSGSMGARMTSGAGMRYPNSTAVDSNGDIYSGQYSTYGIKKFTYATKGVDSTFGQSGTYRGNGNCRSYYPYIMKVHNGYLYVASMYQRRVFRVKLSTGACDWNQYANYPRSVAISKNNILYVGHGSGLLVRNLSTNTNISCSAGGNLYYARNAYGTAVDASASNFYVHYNRWLYRFTIQSNGCPSTSFASRAYRSSWRYGYGMRFHPTNDYILYATSYYEHRLYKFTLSAQRNVFSSAQSMGRCCTGASTSSNIRLYYPAGVAIDTTNNRVFVANYYKHAITAFDLNLGFLKEFGGSAGTRMTGAHEAIKAIVTDSSLTAGVNFGFAYWASGSSGFRSWSGNITTGRANPCSSQNCLKVRAHKQGASRINQII